MRAFGGILLRCIAPAPFVFLVGSVTYDVDVDLSRTLTGTWNTAAPADADQLASRGLGGHAAFAVRPNAGRKGSWREGGVEDGNLSEASNPELEAVETDLRQTLYSRALALALTGGGGQMELADGNWLTENFHVGQQLQIGKHTYEVTKLLPGRNLERALATSGVLVKRVGEGDAAQLRLKLYRLAKPSDILVALEVLFPKHWQAIADAGLKAKNFEVMVETPWIRNKTNELITGFLVQDSCPGGTIQDMADLPLQERKALKPKIWGLIELLLKHGLVHIDFHGGNVMRCSIPGKEPEPVIIDWKSLGEWDPEKPDKPEKFSEGETNYDWLKVRQPRLNANGLLKLMGLNPTGKVLFKGYQNYMQTYAESTWLSHENGLDLSALNGAGPARARACVSALIFVALLLHIAVQ